MAGCRSDVVPVEASKSLAGRVVLRSQIRWHLVCQMRCEWTPRVWKVGTRAARLANKHV